MDNHCLIILLHKLACVDSHRMHNSRLAPILISCLENKNCRLIPAQCKERRQLVFITVDRNAAGDELSVPPKESNYYARDTPFRGEILPTSGSGVNPFT